MCEALWQQNYEQIGEDFQAGRIDVKEFNRRMSRFGFDPSEIDEHLDALEREVRTA